jgi:hypothetical protein
MREVDTEFWWGNLREDPDINGRIMLRWIFRNKVGAWTGFIWLRIRTESGHL